MEYKLYFALGVVHLRMLGHATMLCTCLFIRQETSTRRQRIDLFGFRVKLPAVAVLYNHTKGRDL